MEVSEVELKSIPHARTWDEKQAEKVEEKGPAKRRTPRRIPYRRVS